MLLHSTWQFFFFPGQEPSFLSPNDCNSYRCSYKNHPANHTTDDGASVIEEGLGGEVVELVVELVGEFVEARWRTS